MCISSVQGAGHGVELPLMALQACRYLFLADPASQCNIVRCLNQIGGTRKTQVSSWAPNGGKEFRALWSDFRVQERRGSVQGVWKALLRSDAVSFSKWWKLVINVNRIKSSKLFVFQNSSFSLSLFRNVDGLSLWIWNSHCYRVWLRVFICALACHIFLLISFPYFLWNACCVF